MRHGLSAGHNVDRLDIAAGMRELSAAGWPDIPENCHTRMVIEHALQRWARGEEEAAQRGAVDGSYHGIPLTCWYRVLAAAMAGELKAPLTGFDGAFEIPHNQEEISCCTDYGTSEEAAQRALNLVFPMTPTDGAGI